MRTVAALAISLSVLLTSAPSFAATEPMPVLGSDGMPLEITAQVPQPSGAFLSMALPGAGQFYAGEPTKGWLYLGAGLGAWAGLSALQASAFGIYPDGEQVAMVTLLGFAYSWLVVGSLSTWDAYHSISAQHPALQPPADPLANPGAQ